MVYPHLAIIIAKMDPIVGEFTVTSWADPAKFHTTFPRSVRLDEGYEIALKSISHGPVTNLVHNKFTLCTPSSKEVIEITPRFYESPSDILLDIHKEITRKGTIPLLYEKDGHIKMKMLNDYWIEINENMFLNRTFKYEMYDQVSHIEKRERLRKKKKESELDERIDAMMALLNSLIDEMGSEYQKQGESVKFIRNELEDLQNLIPKYFISGSLTRHIANELGVMSEDILALLGTYKTNVALFHNQSSLISSNLKNLIRKVEYNDNKERIETLETRAAKSEGLNKDNEDKIEDLDMRALTAEEGNKKLDLEVTNMEIKIDSMDRKIDQFTLVLERMNENITADKEPDGSTYSIDKSQMTSRNRENLLVTEVSVPMSPIVKTDLAFLYCSIVENSLVNNEETRVLTTIPITSKRGYNYFQFAQPIYRSISVRQFMDISFHILDVNENYMNFNLYGDDVDKVNRKYPTILNLHIRRSIKGTPSGG